MGNVAIVGFMGTGKSVVSLALARRLGKAYVSTDERIILREKRTIHDLFKEKGESYFREVECRVVEELSAMDGVVIDCGGGVVIAEANVRALKRKGPVVCLEADPAVLYERVRHHRHRPLLNGPDPRGAIGRLLAERKSAYDRADIKIDTGSRSVEEVVDAICDFLEKGKTGRSDG